MNNRELILTTCDEQMVGVFENKWKKEGLVECGEDNAPLHGFLWGFGDMELISSRPKYPEENWIVYEPIGPTSRNEIGNYTTCNAANVVFFGSRDDAVKYMLKYGNPDLGIPCTTFES